MKKIFYLLIILSMPSIGCAQTNYNELSSDQFNEIKYNNVRLSDLINSEVDLNYLINLFGINFSDVTHPQNDEGRDYSSDFLSISYFEDQLASIDVKSSEIIVKINEINIKINSNISLLGFGNSDFKHFPSPNDSNKSYAIFKPEFNNTYLAILFDFQTGIIEEIQFVSPT